MHSAEKVGYNTDMQYVQLITIQNVLNMCFAYDNIIINNKQQLVSGGSETKTHSHSVKKYWSLLF